MATFAGFASFGVELEKLRKELDGAAKRKITGPMADKAQKIAEDVIAGDLGSDRKFPNWAPVADLQVKFTPSNAAILLPTRSGAGVITVSEQGRHQGNASGFSGPGINTRTGVTSRNKDGGVRKVRARKGKRWNGTTQGKRTASKAVAKIDAAMPDVVEVNLRGVVTKHFDVT
jgi:hypothetical protein